MKTGAIARLNGSFVLRRVCTAEPGLFSFLLYF